MPLLKDISKKKKKTHINIALMLALIKKKTGVILNRTYIDKSILYCFLNIISFDRRHSSVHERLYGLLWWRDNPCCRKSVQANSLFL